MSSRSKLPACQTFSAPRPRRLHNGCAALAILATAAVVSLLPLATSPLRACDLCGLVQSSLALDIGKSDVAVIGRLVALPPPTESKDGELTVAAPVATFTVLEVLKGSAALGAVKQIEAPLFDEQPLGGEYLILGAQTPAIVWAIPFSLSPRSRKYLSEIVKLPTASYDPVLLPALTEEDTKRISG